MRDDAVELHPDALALVEGVGARQPTVDHCAELEGRCREVMSALDPSVEAQLHR